MFASPGIDHNTPSSMVGPWNRTLRGLGYPELDVVKHEDGSWSIIQFHRSPNVPSLTPWSHVLTNIRHQEVSPWILAKWSDQLNLEKRHVWERQAADERRMLAEIEEEERRLNDRAERAYTAVIKNPDLMERVARNGPRELTLRAISRHIPNHRFR